MHIQFSSLWKATLMSIYVWRRLHKKAGETMARARSQVAMSPLRICNTQDCWIFEYQTSL